MGISDKIIEAFSVWASAQKEFGLGDSTPPKKSPMKPRKNNF
jgi:hypothetical protein